jgi:hypothetical protein
LFGRHLSAGKTLGSVPPLLHVKHATAEVVPVNRGLPFVFLEEARISTPDDLKRYSRLFPEGEPESG